MIIILLNYKVPQDLFVVIFHSILVFAYIFLPQCASLTLSLSLITRELRGVEYDVYGEEDEEKTLRSWEIVKPGGLGCTVISPWREEASNSQLGTGLLTWKSRNALWTAFHGPPRITRPLNNS